MKSFAIAILISACLWPSGSRADTDQSSAVLGPQNVDLADGAQEILAGNPERGVELTLRGLEVAVGRKERETALSNLCAGYAMMRELDVALRYCNLLLTLNDRYWRAYNNRAVIYVLKKEYDKAEQDLLAGEAINPRSIKLKETRAMLLDATSPVAPRIVIDDRGTEPTVDREH